MRKIETLWLVVGADGAGPGIEGLAAVQVGNLMMPLVCADEKNVPKLLAMAREGAARGSETLKMVKFTVREELEVITPNDQNRN